MNRFFRLLLLPAKPSLIGLIHLPFLIYSSLKICADKTRMLIFPAVNNSRGHIHAGEGKCQLKEIKKQPIFRQCA
jgi:hypothetical protein